MNANSKIVYNYVKENESKNLTAADIAEGTGLGIKSVNGIVTAAFQRHTIKVGEEKVAQPLMERIPAEIELEDGTHKAVKIIRLTEEGKAVIAIYSHNGYQPANASDYDKEREAQKLIQELSAAN